jgi:methyl-accepting chemotaxis protein
MAATSKLKVLPKLGAAMLLVAVSVTLAVTAIASSRQVETMTEQYRSKGEALALSLAFSLSANTRETMARNVAQVRDLLAASKTIAGVSYIYIQDWEASILTHTFEPSFPATFTETNWIEKSSLRPGERVRVAPSVEFETLGGHVWAMDVAAPIAGGNLGVVHVGMDRVSIAAQVRSLRRNLLLVGLGIGLAAVLVGLLMAAALFVRPLRHLTAVTTRIAESGDLTLAVEVRSADEVGELAGSFARMVSGLRHINGGLQESASLLSVSAGDLTTSAREQEESVSRQAAALQQTQVTAQQIKQNSKAAARKADDVLQITRQAGDITRSGEHALDQTLSALADIRAQVSSMTEKIGAVAEASRQIADITQTVKDLADHSNIIFIN